MFRAYPVHCQSCCRVSPLAIVERFIGRGGYVFKFEKAMWINGRFSAQSACRQSGIPHALHFAISALLFTVLVYVHQRIEVALLARYPGFLGVMKDQRHTPLAGVPGIVQAHAVTIKILPANPCTQVQLRIQPGRAN